MLELQIETRRGPVGISDSTVGAGCAGRSAALVHGFHHRPGMTRAELLLVYVVLALVLVLMAGLGGYVQKEAKSRLAEDMLLTLREALAAYHSAVGRYPPGVDSQRAEPAMTALLAEGAARAVVDDWRASFADPAGSLVLPLDPWGLELRYLTERNLTPAQRAQLIGDGALVMPVFESAGPDRDFGDRDSSGMQDNLSSDIPMIFKTIE